MSDVEKVCIPVEVRQWQDTDAHREAFCEWFDKFDHDFETLGPIVILPDGVKVHPGQYVMLIDGDFFWLAGAVYREAQRVAAEHVAQAVVVEAAEKLSPRIEPFAGGDWACAECRPDSDILVAGFQCHVHALRTALSTLRTAKGER